MNIKLYHISDKSGIKRFDPRPAPSDSAKQKGLMVWAIDYDHLHNYLFPRDCPRVTFFASESSDPKDVDRLMGGGSAKHVVAVETGWLPEIQKQCLYQYEFDSKGFTLVDEVAGYYISRKPVIPIAEISPPSSFPLSACIRLSPHLKVSKLTIHCLSRIYFGDAP